MGKQKKVSEKINDTVELVVRHLKQPFLFSQYAILETEKSLQAEHKKAVSLVCSVFKSKKNNTTRVEQF